MPGIPHPGHPKRPLTRLLRAMHIARMASRIYPAQESGRRYQITTKPTPEVGVMTLMIGRVNGEPLIATKVEAQAIKRVKMTGTGLKMTDTAIVKYRVMSTTAGPRIGYSFEFNDEAETQTLLLANEAVEWLLGNPDEDSWEV